MDSFLRDLLCNERDPVEKLAADQSRALSEWFSGVEAHSARFLKTGQRIVALECGHFTATRARYRAACRRCGEMIRQGYDHDGFRRLGMSDEFSWPEDPFIVVHEASRPE